MTARLVPVGREEFHDPRELEYLPVRAAGHEDGAAEGGSDRNAQSVGEVPPCMAKVRMTEEDGVDVGGEKSTASNS